MTGTISGTSPMSLVEYCAKCGKDASRGRRIATTQHFSPPWVWLGLLLAVVPLIVFYYVGRKTLHLSYSLCPECARAQRRTKWTAIGAWLLVTVSALVSVWLENAWILIGSGVLLVVAVVASCLANAPLLVSGCKDEVFTVRGVSEEFLGRPSV